MAPMAPAVKMHKPPSYGTDAFKHDIPLKGSSSRSVHNTAGNARYPAGN